MRRAAEILNGAERVTILGGAGVEGAHDELVRARRTLNAPIVHALRGKEFIEYDNPYDVGMTGLLGFASGTRRSRRADALLMLGTDFPYQQFYPDDANIVQVDIRGRNLGRRTPIDLGLVGTVNDTLTGAAAAVAPEVVTASILTARCGTTARPARRWTSWPSTTATAARSDPNTLRGLPISSPPMMPSSRWTSVPRWYGRRDT